jgi:hypothetical protein
LEIYFLVPKTQPKTNVDTFKINDSKITGKGALAIFGEDWKWGKEEGQVRVRGIQGFHSL